MHPTSNPMASEVELKIVGSNVFGRNPKISAQQTFNMLISDGDLVNAPGYRMVINLAGRLKGRSIYSSDRGGFMIAVIDNTVYKISGPANHLITQPIFQLNTFFGDVFIDENTASQIGICDQKDLWVYNFVTGVATQATLPINPVTGLTITPGYITYHDGYAIIPDTTSSNWYLSAPNNMLSWDWGAGSTYVFGSIQTKPDNAVAVLRAPGKGNLIYVFGRNVMEMWNDVGAQLFPYQRTNSVSVDYGCLSANTIATMDNYVAWLGVNEKSGPVIMVSTGSGFERLSTDGIDFKLADVVFPQQSFAFFYKPDGHILYQITFYNAADNFSLVYDFTTQSFSYATDPYENYHIASTVAYYNNTYYFVAINDGNVYNLSSELYTYDYTIPSTMTVNENTPNIFDIPFKRITNTVRQLDNSKFIANSLTFLLEQGVDTGYPMSRLTFITTEAGPIITCETPPGYVGDRLTTEVQINPYTPHIEMSISKDGGATFSNTASRQLNALGNRANRVVFWKLGQANELTICIKFCVRYRVTVGDGVIEARVKRGAMQ